MTIMVPEDSSFQPHVSAHADKRDATELFCTLRMLGKLRLPSRAQTRGNA